MVLESEFTPSWFQILALVLFISALIHTFSCSWIHKIALARPQGSFPRLIFTLLSEIELVFAFWALLLLSMIQISRGFQDTLHFIRALSFTEPFFVFVIMVIAATKPVLDFAKFVTHFLTKMIPFKSSAKMYFIILGVMPLLGSLITEPACMTVCALLLSDHFLSKNVSTRFKYLSLGILFVNVSIGGTLTHYAAPPVLMVAHTWDWDTEFMFSHFGYKAMIACFLNAQLGSLVLKNELKSLTVNTSLKLHSPLIMILVHLMILTLTVFTLHEPVTFGLIFLCFLGWINFTKKFQTPLKLKKSILVAVFLAGVMIVGKPQDWWLTPIIAKLSPLLLNLSVTGLTAITDNAALTYLGTLIPTLSPDHQIALMSGAVTGGGLTLIANAPNPAGAQISHSHFKDGIISPALLFVAALSPTLIAWICLWGLPTIR
ncbi:MAG: hypothetical protein KA715_06680 [Xanthomonadaceae bacterium]|nr:hypothetical protein [Xanthomonadaceae bacterium]